jgi:hypothetical protein
MSRHNHERLADILAAADAISSHLDAAISATDWCSMLSESG